MKTILLLIALTGCASYNNKKEAKHTKEFNQYLTYVKTGDFVKANRVLVKLPRDISYVVHGKYKDGFVIDTDKKSLMDFTKEAESMYRKYFESCGLNPVNYELAEKSQKCLDDLQTHYYSKTPKNKSKYMFINKGEMIPP